MCRLVLIALSNILLFYPAAD